MLVTIDALTKDYGAYRALDALNLTIAPGEIVGLLGPNGSGKSTALRLLLGFLRPTSGRATIGGHDCWHDGVAARRHVAYLPGELRLYENMTGRRLIAFLARLRGQRVNEELDAFAKQLDIDLRRPLISMSSGMKRKVALLQVLIPQAPLLILDEPTNTLDPTMRDQLLDQLKQARARGQAVLFSSHVLTEVEQVCDRVAILRRGQLVHLQKMDELEQTRSVRVRFDKHPDNLPDWLGPQRQEASNGTLAFDYAGPLPRLIDWLSRQQVEELSVEPSGLSPLYHRYHGTAP